MRNAEKQLDLTTFSVDKGVEFGQEDFFFCIIEQGHQSLGLETCALMILLAYPVTHKVCCKYLGFDENISEQVL